MARTSAETKTNYVYNLKLALMYKKGLIDWNLTVLN